jgi:hypothetical protein
MTGVFVCGDPQVNDIGQNASATVKELPGKLRAYVTLRRKAPPALRRSIR